MWFYDGGEQGFLAGKVAVKGTGSNAGIFYDLPQGGPLGSLYFQKLPP